jgi:hypothetical protein
LKEWRKLKVLLVSATLFFLTGQASATPLDHSSISELELKNVASSRYWNLLLHTRKGLLTGIKSEADGEGFFLSPTGKTDPLSELKATISAFDPLEKRRVGPIKQHPQCAFPERFRYLNEKLNLVSRLGISKIQCVEFDEWKSHFHPQSVTMIFASSYLGSPASMFGHTFLRIDSLPLDGSQNKNDLLDSAVSFEASTPENSLSFGYAVKGLIGSFPGYFSLSPYHLKINLYTNMESRDLWEYKLSLSPLQIDHLLNHAWELSNTYFKYYFFNKNCSYHILSLLEVAEPKWHLREHFNLMTVPSDSIRALTDEPGAVVEIKYRPAVLHTLQNRVRQMSSGERTLFFSEFKDPSHLTGDESALVLDALLDWQEFKTSSEGKTLYDQSRKIPPALLIARAKASETNSNHLKNIKEVSPEKGHRTSKVSLYSGSENNFFIGGFEFRPAIHDELDPDAGYLPHSELVIGRTSIEYFSAQGGNQQNVRLQELTLAEVGTIAPWDPFHRTPSWKIGFGVHRPVDTECLQCLAAEVKGGMGISKYLWPAQKNLLIYGLANGLTEGSAQFDAGYRLGASLLIGVNADFLNVAHLQIEGEHIRFFPVISDESRGLNRLGTTLSCGLSQNLSLRLTYNLFLKDSKNFSRAIFALGHYF